MTFPFDILDWLFNIQQNPGQGQQGGGGIGGWLSGIGGSIASGMESGFVAFFKDIWESVRPFVYIGLGVIIMVAAATWLFKGSIKPSDLAGLLMAVAK